MSTEKMTVVNVEVGVPDLVTALEKKERQLRKVQDRLGRARAANRRLKADIEELKSGHKAILLGLPEAPQTPETD